MAIREADVQQRLMCGSTKKLCQIEKGGRRESEQGLAVGQTVSISAEV